MQYKVYTLTRINRRGKCSNQRVGTDSLTNFTRTSDTEKDEKKGFFPQNTYKTPNVHDATNEPRDLIKNKTKLKNV